MYYNTFILRLSLAIVMCLTVAMVHGQEDEPNYVYVSKEFIQKIKLQQRALVASEMTFPLRRHYPLPDVKSASEFLERYDEIFDDSLVNLVVSSNPVEDWSQVGWRGIMLQLGTLWLDDDGVLIAVNYESLKEEKQRLKLIEEERLKVHPSLQNFKNPRPGFETKTYTIRIDEMNEYDFRIAIWPKDTPMSQKPSIVIDGGARIFEGSGGNNRFEFKQRGLTYTCSEIVMGDEDSPPAEFMIMKGKKEVLLENAIILRR